MLPNDATKTEDKMKEGEKGGKTVMNLENPTFRYMEMGRNMIKPNVKGKSSTKRLLYV